MRIICPNCQRVVDVANNSGDFVHACDSRTTAIDNEDILRIGNWEDYTGTGTEPINQLSLAGRGNSLAGTRAETMGESNFPRGSRGKRLDLFRERQHLEYIEHPESAKGTD